MKPNHKYIQMLIPLVLLLIVVSQVVWIHNMYGLYRQELIDYANQAAQKAILMEIAERTEAIGGCTLYSSNITTPGDTSRFFTKKVRTEDSTYLFTLDKYDPHCMEKILQFVLKKEFPIKLSVVDSLFCHELSQRYKIGKTYFEYYDMEKHKLLSTNKALGFKADFLATDTIPLDIIKTIAVVGYVEVPDILVLRKMGFQLALSILLILIAMGSMLYLGRSFVLQWRTEKLRQSSVIAMTHEFKRPIAAAVAMVSTIPFYVQKNMLDKVSEYAEKTMTELNKLTAYTQRIQQISNNENGQTKLNRTQLEIIPFFSSIAEKYSQDNSKEVRIHAEYQTEKQYLHVDLLHFSNVIDNLVENAIKYSGDKVKIVLKVKDVNKGTLISVVDDGFGMSASEARFIFNRFYRGTGSYVKNKAGFGLGLTYCKSIMEAHHGTITVKTKLNIGSTFNIYLTEENNI